MRISISCEEGFPLSNDDRRRLNNILATYSAARILLIAAHNDSLSNTFHHCTHFTIQCDGCVCSDTRSYPSCTSNLCYTFRDLLHQLLQIVENALPHVPATSPLAFLYHQLYRLISRLGSTALSLGAVFARLIDALFAPKLFLQLILRHTATLILLFALHSLLSIVILPLFSRMFAYVRSCFLSTSYLTAETALIDKMNRAQSYAA